MWEESVGGWAEEEEGKEVVMCSHRLNRFSTCGDESVFLDFWTIDGFYFDANIPLNLLANLRGNDFEFSAQR